MLCATDRAASARTSTTCNPAAAALNRSPILPRTAAASVSPGTHSDVTAPNRFFHIFCPSPSRSHNFGVPRNSFQYASSFSRILACSIGIPGFQSRQFSDSLIPGKSGVHSRRNAGLPAGSTACTKNSPVAASRFLDCVTRKYSSVTRSPLFTPRSSASHG